MVGEGGHEEGVECDAAEIGDGEGEEGKNGPHCAHHLLPPYLILSYSRLILFLNWLKTEEVRTSQQGALLAAL